MTVLAIWMPPKKSNFYDCSSPHLSCSKCGRSIMPGMVIGLNESDFHRLADCQSPFTPECTICAIKYFIKESNVVEVVKEVIRDELNLGPFFKEKLREELKTIIKEEVYDPNGTFSPDGYKQT